MSALEEAKIGMLELPYVSDDRFESLGILIGPMGLKILAECKTTMQIDSAGAAATGSAAVATSVSTKTSTSTFTSCDSQHMVHNTSIS